MSCKDNWKVKSYRLLESQKSLSDGLESYGIDLHGKSWERVIYMQICGKAETDENI